MNLHQVRPERHPPAPKPPPRFRQGDTIGPFTLSRRLGAGGQGEVWSAHDAETGESRCIKLARPGRDDAILDEYAAGREIEPHPNLLRLHEAGWAPCDVAYLVSDLVDGVDLASLPRPLPRYIAYGIALDVARAILALHAAGVVHCDVKPSNVLVSRTGGVKLADYGCVRDTLFSKPTGHTVGYAAPEQLTEPEEAHPNADWFALGVLLFELLTGARPFRGRSHRAYHDAVWQRRRPRLCGLDEAIVGPLLTYDADNRHDEQPWTASLDLAVTTELGIHDRESWRAELGALVDSARTPKPEPEPERRRLGDVLEEAAQEVWASCCRARAEVVRAAIQAGTAT